MANSNRNESKENINLVNSLLGDSMKGVLAGTDIGNNSGKLDGDETLPTELPTDANEPAPNSFKVQSPTV